MTIFPKTVRHQAENTEDNGSCLCLEVVLPCKYEALTPIADLCSYLDILKIALGPTTATRNWERDLQQDCFILCQIKL